MSDQEFGDDAGQDFERGGDFGDDNGFVDETFTGNVGEGGDFADGGDYFGGDDNFEGDTSGFSPAENEPAPAGGAEEGKGGEEVEDRRTEWRREYNARLDAKRSASQAAIQARKEAAAKAISDFYETKETQREAKLNAGRTCEQEMVARLDEVASGNTWDRVLSLIDIKADDPEVQKAEVGRFKTVLVQLKNQPTEADSN